MRARADWPHWERNRDTMAGIPMEKRFMSLVSLGRYSNTFLQRTMGTRWTDGQLGYEEISLPTSCAMDVKARCTMESLWKRSKVKTAKRCIYRPVWECASFLAARKAHNQELWHPVKDRTCLVAWLNSQSSSPTVLNASNGAVVQSSSLAVSSLSIKPSHTARASSSKSTTTRAAAAAALKAALEPKEGVRIALPNPFAASRDVSETHWASKPAGRAAGDKSARSPSPPALRQSTPSTLHSPSAARKEATAVGSRKTTSSRSSASGGAPSRPSSEPRQGPTAVASNPFAASRAAAQSHWALKAVSKPAGLSVAAVR
mmetsp:Transcript_45153/g.118482  ORF Transcript_45153/g.118482 Transcript_45153/m.118482 type:complete len:316 (-) Transcript_45153:424-1371(-)